MKKQISTIITVIVFVTGLSLLLYPTVSNYWNSLHQTKAVANYSDAMEKMDKQKKQDAIDAAKAYNEALFIECRAFYTDGRRTGYLQKFIECGWYRNDGVH
ncbi:MAG: hypothetical protein ACLTEE_04585 [Anaerobutyricum hallii]